jgi:aerobic carbon-monoxide dehydrogenase large subunit
MERLVGTRVLRVEDSRILTGRGRYVDDHRIDNMVHASFVRSPYPHARIINIDVSAARELPGVVAVLTAADLAAVAYPMMLPPEAAPAGYKSAMFTCLATDKVRLVGDTVAMVLAETRALAEDGAELVVVDYEDLPGVGSIEKALSDESLLWEDLGTNVAYDATEVFGDPDAAFANAHKVIKERYRQHRVTHAPMETRGIIANYNPGDGSLEIRMTNQGTGMAKLSVAGLLQIPSNKVHVVASDIGGSFGQKSGVRHEELATAAASKLLGRPVKWIEDRAENLSVGGQAREEYMDAEVAVDADGHILGARFDLVMNKGAYPLAGLPCSLFTTQAKVLIPGAYRLTDYSFRARLVYSNKASYLPYRGPWEIETFVRERLLDRIGQELGIDPVEVRRRNLRQDSEYPVKLPAGPTLDGITLRSGLDKAERVAGWAEFRAEQQRARANGDRIQLGLGVVSFIEPAPGPADYGPAIGFAFPPERAKATLEADGTLTVYTTQLSHGQSHETTLGQVAADALGVPMSSVKIVYGDSKTTPWTPMGTGGSRAAMVATGAVMGAARNIRAQICEIVGHMMEANPADIEVVDGVARVIGSPDHAMPLGQVAMVAWMVPAMLPPGRELGLEATFDYRTEHGGWGQAVHSCFVEVDTDTGQVKIRRYVVVEDCGEMINPGIVEGQVRGGIAQGVAEVLYEHSDYDDDGNFRSSTFMDYLLPTSMEVPPIEIHHVDQSIASQELNFRGVGEGGALGAPAALCSAIEDALTPYGVKITEQHLPPYRILELMGVI